VTITKGFTEENNMPATKTKSKTRRSPSAKRKIKLQPNKETAIRILPASAIKPAWDDSTIAAKRREDAKVVLDALVSVQPDQKWEKIAARMLGYGGVASFRTMMGETRLYAMLLEADRLCGECRGGALKSRQAIAAIIVRFKVD
jgi:hypothetical protein